MALELEKLQEWVGRKESAVDHITPSAINRLAATLDRDEPMPKIGDPIPIGWHQLLFPPVVRHSQLGPDGHPKRRDFMPSVPMPRRMLAGRRVTFHDDLCVGDEVRCESVIKAVSIKQGQTGQMVFVTEMNEFLTVRGLAITEEHDIVYREVAPGGVPQPPKPAPGNPVWSRIVTPDPVMVFRYSSVTFNGHRIHYDLPYTTTVEGYPGLVMNGGLTTLLVFELARTHAATPIRYISARNVRALFVNQPITIAGEPSADGRKAKLWALNPDGALALSAEVEFR